MNFPVWLSLAIICAGMFAWGWSCGRAYTRRQNRKAVEELIRAWCAQEEEKKQNGAQK